MYRAYCYLGEYRNDPNAIRLTSESRNTRKEADALLDRLLALPGITGGDIEMHVPRVGWVVADEDEEETMVILARRRECVKDEQTVCLCNECAVLAGLS